MNILCIGDIVGRGGRRVLREILLELQNRYQVEFTIANAENAAGGFGLIPKKAEELFGFGIDVLTSGNHIWDKREIFPYMEENHRLLRPANYPEGVPGYGHIVVDSHGGVKLAVVNLQGRTFMPATDCPFKKADELIEVISKETKIIIVDFHAEATSEKQAMGRYLDGRVSAVFGTHTHVQTADERILPGGTAYITDVGMTGGHDSVIGMQIDDSLKRFVTQLPGKFTPSRKGLRLNALLLNVERESGSAIQITRIDVPLES